MIHPSGERAHLDWLKQSASHYTDVPVGIGDDCAVLSARSGDTIVTVDMLMDGTDFHLNDVGPYQAGRKAMAVNLSDIAAMAGVPRFAVVALALPKQGAELARELHRGLTDMAREFNVVIVGGDTNSWDRPLAISVTLIGEAVSKGVVQRSGAKPGDAICVTGALGGSILGRHLEPTPRVNAALRLHERFNLHAMIDISDGLSIDLHRILEAGGCGARLQSEAIPIHADAVRLSQQSGRSPLDHALHDGEDFELIFTLSNEEAEELLQRQPIADISVSMIGHCVAEGTTIDGVELVPRGWDHQL